MSNMEEPVAEPIDLQCPFCRKPYTDKSNRRARSKHISYCRKKNLSTLASRRKACDGCVRAKVRCNLDPAGCSRCVSRGNLCTYSARRPNNPDLSNPTPAASGRGSSDDGETPDAQILAPAGNPALSLDEDELSHAAPFTDTIPGSDFLSYTTSTWDNEASWAGYPALLDLLTPPRGEHHLGVDVENSTTSGGTQLLTTHTTGSGQLQLSAPSIPAPLPSKDPALMLERRPCSQTELEVTGDIALHILRSYISMMADGDSPPPFIHPKYRDLAPLGTSRPSPLSAAIKLAKMLVLGRGMNRTLIWRLIRMEQERLLNDYSKFDRWEALEALQSLVLYILMRINEGRREYTNFDTQLLLSTKSLCCYISASFGTIVSSDELKGEMMPWRDWVFFESRRRSATVILIIDSILYARMWEADHGMPEYTVAPAPSPQALWAAENELDWTIGYADYLHANALKGMLKNRDLVALREAAGQDDRWYAYADSFGLLVTLVANLIL